MDFFSRNRLALLFMVATVVLGGCDNSANLTAQEHVQRAKDAEDKGDLTLALLEGKNAVQKDPNNGQWRWLLGELHLKAGDGASAEKEFARAQQLGISAESLKVPMGRALLLQNLDKRVLAEILSSSQTTPSNQARILQIRGDAMINLGQRDEGCKLMAVAARGDATYSPAFVGMAVCAASHQDFPTARGHLEQAIKLDGNNQVAWRYLGDLARIEKDLAGAERAYGTALKVAPPTLITLGSRASVRMELKNYDAAQQDIDAMRKLAPQDPGVNYLQALIFFRQGKIAETRSAIQQVFSTTPNHVPSLFLGGAVELKLGAYEQAASLLKRYLAFVPNNDDARKLLAAALMSQPGQAAEALKALQPALARDSQDAYLYGIAGEAHLKSGNLAEASRYLDKASEMDPANVQILTTLGVVQLASGKIEAGLADLQEAARIDQGQYGTDVMLVLANLRSKNLEKALTAARALEKKQPNSPVTHNLLGLVLIGRNDPAGARKSFEKALALKADFFPAAVNLAKMDLVEKKPDAARGRFETILANDKKHLRAMLALSELAIMRGKEQDALNWLEKAIQTQPAEVQPKLLRINYYLLKANPQKALQYAREALNGHPDNPAVLNLLAQAQLASGEKERALSTLQQLVSLAPNSPSAHLRLAQAQSMAGNTTSAQDSIKRALELKPDYLDAQVALFNLYLQQGNRTEAAKIAALVKARQPNSPQSLMMEGDANMAQGQYAKAAAAYEKAFSLSGNTAQLISLHRALGLAGRGKEADAKIQQWQRQHPEDIGVRAYVAETLMKPGSYDKAIAEYEFILNKSPDHLLVLNNLAWLYQQVKDRRALATAERAHKLNANSPAIQDTLGWILVERGETARGLALLQQSYALSQSPGTRYRLAAALAKAGERDKARRELSALLTSKAKFPEAEQARALLRSLQANPSRG